MHKPKPYAPDLFYPRNRAERRKARRDGYPIRSPWSFLGDIPVEPINSGVRPGDLVSFDIEQLDKGVSVVETDDRAVVVIGRRRRVQVLQELANQGVSNRAPTALRTLTSSADQLQAPLPMVVFGLPEKSL